MMNESNDAPDEIARHEQGARGQTPPLSEVREECQVPQAPDRIVDGERPEDALDLLFFP